MAEEIPDQEEAELEQLTLELEQGMREAGWAIQDRNETDLNATRGVAVRDFPSISVKKNLDYLLFVNGEAIGVTWNAKSLLNYSERELRTFSTLRRLNTFPVPFNPIPIIVFQHQPAAKRERRQKTFQITRIIGPRSVKSYRDRFPKPDTLSHLVTRKKIFQRLGGQGLMWLLSKMDRSGVGKLEVSSYDRERAAKRRKWFLLVSLPLGIAFLIWLVIGPASIWAMPVSGHNLGAKDFADIRNTTRQVMTAVILGTAAAGSIFAGRTYRLSLRGQRSDRFSKAVSQLSSRTTSERVGGIFALEQLMLESGDQHEPIVEVLSHFVREQAGGLLSADIDSEQPAATERVPHLEATCQVALAVLARRPVRPESKPLDLSWTNLAGARLPRAMLRGAVLKGANLRGADLEDADLSDADLTKAVLAQASMTGARMARSAAEDADFFSASMVGADLTMAVLNGANMESAQLDGAMLRNARMLGVKLTGAQMGDADLTGAHLRYANLDEAYLVKAVLRKAFLRGAGLRQTNLANTDLREAYLRLAKMPSANLLNANLGSAMLHDTYLNGANLSGANLAGADLSGTLLDEADLSGATLEPVEYSLEEITRQRPTRDAQGRIHISQLHPPHGLRPNQLLTAKIDSRTTLPPELQKYLKEKNDGAV